MLVLFSAFFYLIWLWYLALLPIAVFIFMLSHWIKNVFTWIKLEILWEKRSLILIWLVTMIWISWILFFIWVKEISVYLTLLILNTLVWFWSHIFKYEDGKLVFEIWTWIMVIIILWTSLFSWWFFVFCEAATLLSCFMLWVYSFLQFIIWIFYPRDEKWQYEVPILWAIVIWWTIIKYFYPAWWIFPLILFILTILFVCVYFIQHWEMPSKETVSISVRRILAWERIFKKFNIPKRKVSLYEWLDGSPKWFERIFEFINLWILIFMLCFFFYWIFTSSEIKLNLWYWWWIVLFLVNVFLLKRIWYASDVSRFALALVANFVLYSMLLISWSSISNILPFLIVWWFVCQIALFFVDRININLFWEKDYVYWTIVTFIAFVCNIILLCRVDLPGQFLFSLIFLYVWIELMLMYYIIRFLNDMSEASEKAELENKKMIQDLVNSDIWDSDSIN